MKSLGLQLLSLTLILFTVDAVLATDPPSDWTQWRGPNRDSKVTGDWPATLTESNLTKVWTKTVWTQLFWPNYSQRARFRYGNQGQADGGHNGFGSEKR